jgi:hypothetical protein
VTTENLRIEARVGIFSVHLIHRCQHEQQDSGDPSRALSRNRNRQRTTAAESSSINPRVMAAILRSRE